MKCEPRNEARQMLEPSAIDTGDSGKILEVAGKYCIYSLVYTENDMATAKVFQSGNSQAVRLPKQFRLTSDDVEIFRRGDEIVLREKPTTLVRAFELLCGLPDLTREDGPPQEREGL